MVATRGRTFKRPWRGSCHSSKLKSSSAPIGRKDSWCFHGVGSSNAPLLGSTAAEGLQRIGRTSIATRWRFCGLPQSASCSENFVIPPDVFGQTLKNPRHERFAQLIFEGITNGEAKPYYQQRAYRAVGYTPKDVGKRNGSAQAASSRLLSRVMQRVREFQAQAAKHTHESADKIVRELNEVLTEARADKAHSAAVSAIATKAKILNIGAEQSNQQINFATAHSKRDIGERLLQAVGYREPDDVSIQQAIALNDRFVSDLEELARQAQGLTLEQLEEQDERWR